jgi:hypothetical protein
VRFFEQQRLARAQTVRLLLLFGLTLLVLVVAVNAALALTWRLIAWQDAAYPAYFFHINTGMTLLGATGAARGSPPSQDAGAAVATWLARLRAKVLQYCQ